MSKLFFWKDLSRGQATNTFNLEQIRALDLEEGAGHWTGEEAINWAMAAKEGDQWGNETDSLVCIQDETAQYQTTFLLQYTPQLRAGLQEFLEEHDCERVKQYLLSSMLIQLS